MKNVAQKPFRYITHPSTEIKMFNNEFNISDGARIMGRYFQRRKE